MKTPQSDLKPSDEPKDDYVRVSILRPIVHLGEIRMPPGEVDVAKRDLRELLQREIVELIDDESPTEDEA